jgi:citrate synthase
VKRGLRDATGRGVLTSLTRISEVKGCTVDGQDTIPCPGVLYYRGYDVRDLEARALDAALILHRPRQQQLHLHQPCTTSTGTDTYSAMTASLCSLKDPRHGGANTKVVQMMADLRSRVRDPADPEQVRQYLTDLLAGRAYVPMDRR